MKTELYINEIYPKVILAGTSACFTMKAKSRPAYFAPNEELTVELCPLGQGSVHSYPRSGKNGIRVNAKTDDKAVLKVELMLPAEDNYFLRVYREQGCIAQFSVYAVNEDLRGCLPYRGDMHMHTCRSDGQNSPYTVAAAYRGYGYDFLAVTDHHRYYPSVDCINKFKPLKLSYDLVPGEEVHLPGCDPHIVAFGGRYSINGLLKDTAQNAESTVNSIDDSAPRPIATDEYIKQVNELAATLNIPEGIEPFTYAACCWIFEHIRESGGLGIFCHPAWINDVFQVPYNVLNYIMRQKPFDAFEVLGGESYYAHNGIQTALYNQLRAEGYRIPIVGSTDSHSAFNNRNGLICSTIVFAKSNTPEGIKEAVRSYRSVAVDTISDEYRLVGEERYVRYATFLMEEFYPIHDMLLLSQQPYLLDFAGGDDTAIPAITAIEDRIKNLFNKSFAY